jgi:hypothetical protein
MLMFTTLMTSPAMAYRMSGNGRLDRAIRDEREHTLVVAGRITRIERGPAPDTFVFAGTGQIDADFHVDSVILGDAALKNRLLPIDVTDFIWPDQLVPFKVGATCIFVLDSHYKRKSGRYPFSVVAPTSKTDLPAAVDTESAKHIIAEQILAELKAETNPKRQRVLIIQALPILTAKQAEALVPFLDNDDPWVKRSALAGLLWATGRPEYIERSIADIKQFLDTNALNQHIDGFEQGTKILPQFMLFEVYFFLPLGGGREEDERAAFLRPILRMIAGHPRLPEDVRDFYGLEPLLRKADRSDATFLYARYRQRHAMLRPYKRQQFIMAFSRILQLGLSNWCETDFLRYEHDQHRTVTKALINAGLIRNEDAFEVDDKRPE